MKSFTHVKKLKRALSALAAAFTLASQFSPAVSADMLDGETTRAFRSLTGGAAYSEYVLGAASSYGVQEFSAVTFDCARDDLQFDVLESDGGLSFADTVNAFRRDSSRHVIAALSTAPGVGGEKTACGYTVYGGTGGSGGIGSSGGGEISACSARACSFGVAADGSALIGEISLNIEIRNRRTGETLVTSALNSFPQGEQIALYTDAADLPDGTCALCVEVAPGYSLTPGAPVEGTVVGALLPDGSYIVPGVDSATGGAYSAPDSPDGVSEGANGTSDGACITPEGADGVLGGANDAPDSAYGMSDGACITPNNPDITPNNSHSAAEGERVFIAARGDYADIFSGFEAADRITLTADISDASGRTALWRTVTCAVPGIALVRNSEKVCFEAQPPRSAAVIGLRPDGSAVMLASYGAQKGYSLGFTLGDLADICMTLGMTDAIVLGCGENVMMLCESEDASLAPTGKSTGKGCDGAIVISVPDGSRSENSPSPDETGDADETDAVTEYKDHSPAVLTAKNAGYSAVLADGSDLLRRMSAALIPHSQPQCCDTPAVRASFFTSDSALTEASICSLYRQLEFEATGEWLTLVIKESDLDAWYGKIFGAVI